MKTILSITLVLAALLPGCGEQAQRPVNRQRRRAASETELAIRLAKRQSVVYPHSVVAGGVESAEDVREAMGRDPEVAAHYSDVNVTALRASHFKEDTRAYVSFRKAGKVYWTRQKVHIAAGERILTDGDNCVRGRCGNRISWTPKSPVLPAGEREPESAELITPGVRGQSIEELPVPAVIGELTPSALAPNAPPPAIASGHMAALPGYAGGGVSTASGAGGSGGGGAGGGGGGGGGVMPGSAAGEGSYITGGPVVFVPSAIVPGLWFPSTPVAPPGVPAVPPPASVTWTPALPYVPAQIFIAGPQVSPGRPAETLSAWYPSNWNPVNGDPPSRPAAQARGDEPPGPPGIPAADVLWPPSSDSPEWWTPDSPPAVPPPAEPGGPKPPSPAAGDVPEPATMWTAGLAAAAALWWRRRAGQKSDRSTL